MSFILFGGTQRFRFPAIVDESGHIASKPRGRRDMKGRTLKAKKSRSNKNGKRPQWNDWKRA